MNVTSTTAEERKEIMDRNLEIAMAMDYDRRMKAIEDAEVEHIAIVLLHSIAYYYEDHPNLKLTQADRGIIEGEIELVGNSSGLFCSEAETEDDGIDMCHWRIIGYAFR